MSIQRHDSSLRQTCAVGLTCADLFLLDQLKLEKYAVAVAEKGAALDNCYGFIDGTVRQICRPQDNQRVVYNGHKRVHAIKFQSVTVPSGMIAQIYGPVGKCQSS